MKRNQFSDDREEPPVTSQIIEMISVSLGFVGNFCTMEADEKHSNNPPIRICASRPNVHCVTHLYSPSPSPSPWPLSLSTLFSFALRRFSHLLFKLKHTWIVSIIKNTNSYTTLPQTHRDTLCAHIEQLAAGWLLAACWLPASCADCQIYRTKPFVCFCCRCCRAFNFLFYFHSSSHS